MRILVLNAGNLADVVQMLPAFSDAKHAFPHIAIDVVVDERWAQVPSWHPAVDRVFTLAVKDWRIGMLSLVASNELKRLRIQLRKHAYDWVVDLHGNWLSAWFSRSFNTNSVGFSRLNDKKKTYSFLYNQKIPAQCNLHRVEQIRRLFSEGINYKITYPNCFYSLDANSFCQGCDNSVVLCFGCKDNKQRYPAALGRQLIQNLVDQGLRVKLLWRDAESGSYVKSMAEGISSVEIMPKLSLSGIAAVMVQARAIVTVNNGLSHLAAALGIPTVCLLGPKSDLNTAAKGANQLKIIEIHSPGFDYPPAKIQTEINDLIDQYPSICYSTEFFMQKSTA